MTYFVKEDISFLTAVIWFCWMVLKKKAWYWLVQSRNFWPDRLVYGVFYYSILGNIFLFTIIIIIIISSSSSSSSGSSSSSSTSSCFCCLCLLLLLCRRLKSSPTTLADTDRLSISKPVVDDRKKAEVDRRSTLSIFCFQWLRFPVILLSCKVNSRL
jgi:hypothetical protein